MILKKIVKTYWFLFLITGLVILIDQLSKSYVRAYFNGPEGAEMWAPWPWLLPYARIIHVTNTGVAFGMFQGMALIFAVLALIIAASIIYYFPRVPEQDWVLRLSMSMMLGGALGNLIDRLTQNGKVTDFISVGSFPVFNVADSSITIGVGILLLGVWVQERQLKAQQREASPVNNDSPSLESEPPTNENHPG